MPEKNNVLRLLQARKVPHEVFRLPREKLGALETAQRLGVPAGRVFKTIVVLRMKSGKPILAIVPGDREVDLKKLAAAAAEKKLKLATQAEAESLTRLQVGGISPLALLNRGFEMYLDISAREWEQIHLSGGERGLNIRLGVDDLLHLTGAKLADIAAQPAEKGG
jgi:Cys-tRNA(Pro)/Cys-tRNA(Cys) deacylase